MNLLLIFGPPAVGKMTVGQEIAKRTGMRVLHNHMTIDLVLNFFEFGTPAFERLVRSFRIQLLEEIAGSDLPGVIVTLVYALDLEEDHIFVEEISEIFQKQGGKVWFLELEASLEERLKRNKTENRLKHKPTKRDFGLSEGNLLKFNEIYKMNSDEKDIFKETHLKIRSDHLTAAETAELAVKKLGLGELVTK
ncbi:MAG: AAA family ATPase [Bacteroidetes bacterium]|nr:AAA family ATPase [Bacteroidota bacterium]